VLGPDLLRVEVTSVLRHHAGTGQLTSEQADAAISDLITFPVKVFPTSPLIPRVWELRLNLSAYDGCYVALAEVFDCILLTADHRLARSTGPRCQIEAM
jgi:predicted nucleic acid-binding protein